MAEQSTFSPAAKIGELVKQNWQDYKSPQEFAEAIADALLIAVDAGEKGDAGDQGATGDSGATQAMQLEATVSIAAGTTQVNLGTSASGKILRLRNTSGATPPVEQQFALGGTIGEVVLLCFPEGSTKQVVGSTWVVDIYQLVEI